MYRALGHPVTWMGALLAALERRLNRPQLSFAARRGAGVAALALLLGAAALATMPPDLLLPGSAWGFAALVILAASLPAQRSLDAHVRAVADALERDGLEAGRAAVAMIVGRDTAVLDRAGVCRAAIESLAENFSDGVVAPALWIAAGGLTGGTLYKAINTADSMIGHRDARHGAFGWAAARLDDVVNLPASRLSVLWVALAAAALRLPLRPIATAVRRDAPRHRSPNAGYPEAAFAGALGLRLAGPRVYGAEQVADAFMGDGRCEADVDDIRRALRLYRAACGVQMGVLAVMTLEFTR